MLKMFKTIWERLQDKSVSVIERLTQNPDVKIAVHQCFPYSLKVSADANEKRSPNPDVAS